MGDQIERRVFERAPRDFDLHGSIVCSLSEDVALQVAQLDLFVIDDVECPDERAAGERPECSIPDRASPDKDDTLLHARDSRRELCCAASQLEGGKRQLAVGRLWPVRHEDPPEEVCAGEASCCPRAVGDAQTAQGLGLRCRDERVPALGTRVDRVAERRYRRPDRNAETGRILDGDVRIDRASQLAEPGCLVLGALAWEKGDGRIEAGQEAYREVGYGAPFL